MDKLIKGKIFLSYPIIITAGVSYVGIAVALGLIVSLVNPPACKENSRDLLNRQVRSVMNEELASYRARPSIDILQTLLKDAKQVPKIDRCDEFNTASGNVWEKFRLPTNIKPTHYDIEIFTPIFAAEVYSGEIKITIEVLEPTNTIVLNAKYLSVYLPTLLDSSDTAVPLKCGDVFLPSDKFVLLTQNTLAVGTYTLELFYTGYLNIFKSGLFDIKYGYNDDEFAGHLYISHFEPLDASKAYPCFDEPQFKATYTVAIDHPEEALALSNMPSESDDPIPGINGTFRTIFKKTPKMPSYLMAYALFNKNDFSYKQVTSSTGVPIRLWARKEFIDDGYAEDPANMILKLFNALEDTFKIEVPGGIPPKIDVFACPYYPEDALPHLGLPIFKENVILFKESSMSEKSKQTVALLIAKQLSEFWFGNYVTFKWWNELWLQEALGDYMKYRVVGLAYPDWRIYNQFITEELIHVLVEDGYPSSHPVIKDVLSPLEIDEYFDSVERSKAAAILRMMEYEVGEYGFLLALYEYLKFSVNDIGNVDYLFNIIGPIRKWPAKDFADRWFRQSNYPRLIIRKFRNNTDGRWYVSVRQERFKNSEFSIFGTINLYPSPYNWVWYVPLKCSFGKTIDDTEPFDITFDVDTANFTALIDDGYTDYKWIHCDQEFIGYYMMDYDDDNWRSLGQALKIKNEYLEEADRSNIIHNLFASAYTERTSYNFVVEVLEYIKDEKDYLPWYTFSKHVTDMVSILEYRRSFYPVAKYFRNLMKTIEQTDIWEATGTHLEQMVKQTILELACRLQDPDCLNNATALWPIAYDFITDPSANNTIAPHVRSVVYNYHFQNTYGIYDWLLVFGRYEVTNDFQEQHRFIESLTYSRIPALLARILDAKGSGRLKIVDFFDVFKMMSKNPLGRELSWDYFRSKYSDINTEFGVENPSIGNTLIDIVTTFEDEFLFYELVEFTIQYQSGPGSGARFKALEKVSTNIIWLNDKEKEIIEAFGKVTLAKKTPRVDVQEFKAKLESYREQFIKQGIIKLADQ